MKTSPCSRGLVPTLALAIAVAALAVPPAQADWPNANATKWVQLPNTTPTGLDVLAEKLPGSTNGAIILADDFLCTKTGPITDIHLWTSWLGNQPDQTISFTLGIWSDVPAITNAGGGVTPSHPGQMLWTENFLPGRYQLKYWTTSREQFFDPDVGILGPDTAIWQYNFYPTNPFTQAGTTAAPIVYWLSMTAVSTGTATTGSLIGWKTSTNHWNDNAVFGHMGTNGLPLGDWNELFSPQVPAVSLDLAFALTTSSTRTNPPPSPTNKWLQLPNTVSGYDVRSTFPDILADDFLCTNAGAITNIQIWTSWLNNQVDPNATITLGIWSDVPGSVTAANATFSHPGFLQWSATFPPGSYTFGPYATGAELFYDPNANSFIGTDSEVFLYNFNPPQPFCQQGSTNNPVVYWLSMTATTAAGTAQLMGWKTSITNWNDAAVHGHVNAAGTPLGDWQAMHSPSNGVNLDLAFLLNNGPVSPDCDTNQRPKFIQYPDKSTNGLDVRATGPHIVGDDFLCKSIGPVDGITVWGSWLNDVVDPNVTFQLSLWSDVPGISNAPPPGSPSHPGSLICTETFLPPQTVGTSVDRYHSSLYASNLQETFYDPDLSGTGGFIGSDTQIWRYDFYPQAQCWKQRGTPFSPRIYWITLTATPSSSSFLFGWKTSTNHFQDDAVTGHVDPNNNPLGDWKDLHDPRTGISLDLAFQLRAFPVVGINKDIKNNTGVAATGVQIILGGVHEITWHYDGTPSWPSFSVSTAGGNTTLTWSGMTVAPGAIDHVGFDVAGSVMPPIVGMNWLSGSSIIGHPVQACFHTWNNFNGVTVNNCFHPLPLTVLSGSVEFYGDVLRLDLMNPGVSNRNPILTATLPITPTQVMPGGAMFIPSPTAPTGAMYGMLMVQLGDESGNPVMTDFVLLPLDNAFAPMIDSITISGNGVNLTWTSVPGRTYMVQSKSALNGGTWSNAGEVMATDDTTSMTVPVSGAAEFYRIFLEPE
jgi:hypothetical protein